MLCVVETCSVRPPGRFSCQKLGRVGKLGQFYCSVSFLCEPQPVPSCSRLPAVLPCPADFALQRGILGFLLAAGQAVCHHLISAHHSPRAAELTAQLCFSLPRCCSLPFASGFLFHICSRCFCAYHPFITSTEPFLVHKKRF